MTSEATTTERSIDVTISEDGTVARLCVAEGVSPARVTVERIVHVAEERGVHVSEAVRQRAAEIVAEYEEHPREMVATLAEGEAAQHGRDGWIEWKPGYNPLDSGHGKLMSESEAAQAADDEVQSDPPDEKESAASTAGSLNDRVDYYSVLDFTSVAEGASIAVLHSPTAGVDGRGVTGRLLKARQGRPCPIRIGEGLEVEDDGSIRSTAAGVLQLVDSRLSVTRNLHVKEHVDFSTGHVCFNGSVSIGKGIRDRFVVVTADDVTVHGLVESATVVAGKNLIFTRGMAARSRGQLLVGQDAEIGFLNHVRGRIGGNLTVHREIIDCQLIVQGDLNAPRASMIGGAVSVNGNIEINCLGSEGSVTTRLSVGDDSSSKAGNDEFDQLNNAADADLTKLQQDYTRAAERNADGFDSDNPHGPEDLKAMADQLASLTQSCREKKRDRNAKDRKPSIRVHGSIHPKVTLRIGQCELLFNRLVQGPVLIDMNRHGQVQMTHMDRGTVPLRDVAIVRKASRRAA